MPEYQPPAPVKFLAAILYNDEKAADEAVKKLVEIFGPVDFESSSFPFDFTDYYENEMGGPLFRKFVSFKNLRLPDFLLEAKIECARLEAGSAVDGKRTVNIDPGYIDHFKLVLASFKFGGQKIYMGGGIYADMTLWYSKGSFEPFAWSFPDFKSKRYDWLLMEIRRRYKSQAAGS
ncbi:MAG: DUF4416 family protein [Chloroflexi bacterium]|nr:DUF4416 family protein [Chloroflexota bacterium]